MMGGKESTGRRKRRHITITNQIISSSDSSNDNQQNSASPIPSTSTFNSYISENTTIKKIRKSTPTIIRSDGEIILSNNEIDETPKNPDSLVTCNRVEKPINSIAYIDLCDKDDEHNYNSLPVKKKIKKLKPAYNEVVGNSSLSIQMTSGVDDIFIKTENIQEDIVKQLETRHETLTGSCEDKHVGSKYINESNNCKAPAICIPSQDLHSSDKSLRVTDDGISSAYHYCKKVKRKGRNKTPSGVKVNIDPEHLKVRTKRDVFMDKAKITSGNNSPSVKGNTSNEIKSTIQVESKINLSKSSKKYEKRMQNKNDQSKFSKKYVESFNHKTGLLFKKSAVNSDKDEEDSDAETSPDTQKNKSKIRNQSKSEKRTKKKLNSLSPNTAISSNPIHNKEPNGSENYIKSVDSNLYIDEIALNKSQTQNPIENNDSIHLSGDIDTVNDVKIQKHEELSKTLKSQIDAFLQNVSFYKDERIALLKEGVSPFMNYFQIKLKEHLRADCVTNKLDNPTIQTSTCRENGFSEADAVNVLINFNQHGNNNQKKQNSISINKINNSKEPIEYENNSSNIIVNNSSLFPPENPNISIVSDNEEYEGSNKEVENQIFETIASEPKSRQPHCNIEKNQTNAEIGIRNIIDTPSIEEHPKSTNFMSVTTNQIFSDPRVEITKTIFIEEPKDLSTCGAKIATDGESKSQQLNDNLADIDCVISPNKYISSTAFLSDTLVKDFLKNIYKNYQSKFENYLKNEIRHTLGQHNINLLNEIKIIFQNHAIIAKGNELLNVNQKYYDLSMHSESQNTLIISEENTKNIKADQKKNIKDTTNEIHTEPKRIEVISDVTIPNSSSVIFNKKDAATSTNNCLNEIGCNQANTIKEKKTRKTYTRKPKLNLVNNDPQRELFNYPIGHTGFLLGNNSQIATNHNMGSYPYNPPYKNVIVNNQTVFPPHSHVSNSGGNPNHPLQNAANYSALVSTQTNANQVFPYPYQYNNASLMPLTKTVNSSMQCLQDSGLRPNNNFLPTISSDPQIPAGSVGIDLRFQNVESYNQIFQNHTMGSHSIATVDTKQIGNVQNTRLPIEQSTSINVDASLKQFANISEAHRQDQHNICNNNIQIPATEPVQLLPPALQPHMRNTFLQLPIHINSQINSNANSQMNQPTVGVGSYVQNVGN